MLVTLVYPEKDQTVPLHAQSELTLETFRGLCAGELGIPADHLLLIHDGTPLIDDDATLGTLQIKDNDIILVQRVLHTGPGAQQRPAGMPRIDFSAIRMPNEPTSFTPQSPPTDRNNYEALRLRFLNSPSDLALMKERNPEFAKAIIEGGDAFRKQLEKMRETQAQQEREKIRLLNADPLDPAVQNKIAEEIRQKNIQENMNMAIEEAPESFGQVVMLWINVKVNGHSVKEFMIFSAFVDSGAQMTIMSAQCAERCNIMRLVDRRWEGVAKGVGTQKIIGRIHLAQMQIENDFLQCSFSVLEDQPMDVLLGLDMLRRHQCSIDLKENKLRIGTTGTETKFLSESELPSHSRLHDPNARKDPEVMSQEAEDDLIARTLRESSEEARRREQSTSNNPQTSASTSNTGAFSEIGRILSNIGGLPPAVSESDVKKLTDMGFSRSVAEEELRQCGGNVQLAVGKLLARSLKSP